METKDTQTLHAATSMNNESTKKNSVGVPWGKRDCQNQSCMRSRVGVGCKKQGCNLWRRRGGRDIVHHGPQPQLQGPQVPRNDIAKGGVTHNQDHVVLPLGQVVADKDLPSQLLGPHNPP